MHTPHPAQAEYDHRVSEMEWRYGNGMRPYVLDAAKLAKTIPSAHFPERKRPKKIDFVHFPIVDCATVGDEKVLRFAFQLCQKLANGQRMYVCTAPGASISTA